MGNRAVIAFGSMAKKAPAIYVHWNGGRASIEGFLSAARQLSIRGTSAESRDRVAAAIRTFLGGSVYCGTVGESDCDNWDNGTYIVDSDLSIKARKYRRDCEEINPEKTAHIVGHILQRAPIVND